MDASVSPSRDFYQYAAGSWLRSNPVPPDKTRWSAFGELQERTFFLLQRILEQAREGSGASPRGPRHQVGEFYASALDTPRLEELRHRPLESDRAAIERIDSPLDLVKTVAALHAAGLPALFHSFADPDLKESTRYALYLVQGGLSLPNREYYLAEEFARLRDAYRVHIGRMLAQWGGSPEAADAGARTVLTIETELATASRTQTALRDLEKNYARWDVAKLDSTWPGLHLREYLDRLGAGGIPYVVVGQEEFFSALERLLADRPLADWRVYLRWNLLHESAPYLHEAAESEDFDFFHRRVLGQATPEPRWKRAAVAVDQYLGEALGQLYVDEHFPPAARAKMAEMVRFLCEVFHDRLEKLDWMTEPTRRKALEKFDRFVAHIGHPETFRDYSSVTISRDDLWGNVRRATAFEVHRRFARLGGPVDRSEWGMSPPTVNAYFEPTQNQIFFPAGILQPPFFDPAMDDAVNYGGIGAVIGHEITHGYDDQGRKSDADGNLRDWWTEEDAREFADRAQKVVRLYEAGEPLPGLHVNGELTLGENIADFGGVSIAFEALQRTLAEHPERRQVLDGLTPEQRFFLSWAQVWRTNYTEPELRRRLIVDPHAPGRYRAVVPLENFPAFHDAFRPGSHSVLVEPDVRIW
ncbi:MAG: M13 family metallopeptidase [Thermoplasmata archaeon]